MPNTLGTLPGLLKRLLESTLDRSIIAFVSTPAKDEDLGPYHIRLDQNADESSKTIAVVDRTADIPSSAEAIVAASFGFGCQSPYAPDFVLVNEYVKESFLQALMQNAITFRPNLTPMSKTRSAHTDSPKKTQGIEGAHIMSTIGRATIVETHQL